MTITKEQSLARASKTLMLKEPFYGYFLQTLNKVWDEGVGTAGVSRRNIGFQLTIAPEFWTKLTDTQQRGILKHELLHIAFNHLFMRDAKYPDHVLFNIAADMEINQYIEEGGLPEGCIDINEYRKELPNLKSKAGTHYYYKELQKEEKENPDGKIAQDLENARNGMGDPTGGHGTWKEFEDLNEAEKKMVQKQAEYQIQQTANACRSKGRGTIPGELAEILDKIENPEAPKFDWKGYLRRFAGGSQKIYTKKLRRKFNKRFDHLPGLKIKPKKHICVAIDTSGSVSSEELKEFFGEIDHIYRTGADITVVQCDTQIGSIEPYKKGCELKIVGRGGTSFTPAVDHYNEYQRRYSALIYLTDGEAPAPENPPKGRCLWVMSSKSHLNNDLPGHCIKLN